MIIQKNIPKRNKNNIFEFRNIELATTNIIRNQKN